MKDKGFDTNKNVHQNIYNIIIDGSALQIVGHFHLCIIMFFFCFFFLECHVNTRGTTG